MKYATGCSKTKLSAEANYQAGIASCVHLDAEWGIVEHGKEVL